MASPASGLARTLLLPDSPNSRLSISASPPFKKYCYYRINCVRFVSMNGCGGGLEPVEIRERRVLSPVPSVDSAILRLRSEVSYLDADPPRARSGIIRLEVPVEEKVRAIDWLQEQSALPHCYFSGRGALESGAGVDGSFGSGQSSGKNVVSVAGVGSAVHFTRVGPFSLEDWTSIKRFLMKDCSLPRAYGAIRFDPGRSISAEWSKFGSFYFVIPQVEFNELEDSLTLSTNIAWDDGLRWPWRKAIDCLHISLSQIPTQAAWVLAVRKALQFINGSDSELMKVVLARSSRILTNSCLDPIMLLSRLMVEGQNAYQFSIQPPNSPAFIGNTPEQLFHRKHLYVSSEALAGTRARGVTMAEDLKIEHDLLLSPKDHIEFTIVREKIRRKLEVICDEVVVEPRKAIRKLPRVQHLSAQFKARLRNADDEFAILSSLHPTPAVCGLPTEQARQFIAETEPFDRGMYAGPVGWFGGNESEFAVGIRSALVDQKSGVFAYAGTGIVVGTDPSSEWQELELKVSQFTKLFQPGKINLAGKR